MSIDIEARLREANPLRRDEHVELLFDDLPQLLRSDIRAKREGRMTDTTDRREPTTEQQMPAKDEDRVTPLVSERTERSRRLRAGLAMAAAFAVVAIAIAAVVTLVTGDEPDVAGAPEEVATGFVEAYGAFDVDRAITYLADDANVSDFGGTLEDFRLVVEWFEAMGYEQMLDSCQVLGTAAVTTVRCDYHFHLLRSEEVGLGPYSGSSFDLSIRDGAVIRASSGLEIGEFSPERWEPFAIWVSATYPEDAAVMYTDDTFSDGRLTEESFRLWELRSLEFVEVELGG